MNSPAVTLPSRRLVTVDKPCQARGLISRERVHRVDQDRLDPWLSRLTDALVQDRQQEALGLPRTGARGDQRRLEPLAAQPLERALLVRVRWPPERHVFEERWPRHPRAETAA